MRGTPASSFPNTRWLKRLRRELAGSGKVSQLALSLSGQDGTDPDSWRRRLQAIVTGQNTPDPDLILRLESLLARPRSHAQVPLQENFAF